MQRSLGGSASPCHGARCRGARCRSAPCQGARCHGAHAAMLGVQRRNCPPWLCAGGAAHPCAIPGMSPSVPRWKAPTAATQPGCRATRTGRSTGRGSAPAVPPQAAGADPSTACPAPRRASVCPSPPFPTAGRTLGRRWGYPVPQFPLPARPPPAQKGSTEGAGCQQHPDMGGSTPGRGALQARAGRGPRTGSAARFPAGNAPRTALSVVLQHVSASQPSK